VQRYTAVAERERLAEQAIAKLSERKMQSGAAAWLVRNEP
jgi:hypothetical protein